MKNFEEEEWFEEDLEENAEEVIEKIQSLNNANLILKDIQITKSSHFRKDIKKIAKEYIRAFFKNKKNYLGEKIKKDQLYKEKYINNILNKSISESAKKIYSTLEYYKKYSRKNKSIDVTNDIKLVNETLKKIYKSKIPQQFAGGFLLMYLELCKGVKVED